MAATVLALAAVRVRFGLFALFFVFYSGGYPMLQFDVRHYFHLEFMTWWSIGFLVDELSVNYRDAYGNVKAMLRSIRERYAWSRAVRILSATAVGVLVALWAARAYQQRSATALFQQYVDAPKQPIALGAPASGALHRVALGRSASADPHPADLLEVDLDASRCGPMSTMTFVYERPYETFSHTVDIEDLTGDGLTRVFEPVVTGFAGLRFADAPPRCVQAAYRLMMPERFPLLIAATLRPSWRRHAMFQQLAPWRWHL